jgi:hypothetical protein
MYGREITKYTVIYGVHIQFWPTLLLMQFSVLAHAFARFLDTRLYRVGQKRIYPPYMTKYLVISLPEIPYIYGSGQHYVCVCERWSVILYECNIALSHVQFKDCTRIRHTQAASCDVQLICNH